MGLWLPFGSDGRPEVLRGLLHSVLHRWSWVAFAPGEKPRFYLLASKDVADVLEAWGG